MRMPVSAACLSLILICAASAYAQNQKEPNFAAEVVDPISLIKTLTLRTVYAPSLWGLDDKENEVDIRTAFPHDAFGMQHLTRITIPYMTSLPSGNRGLSDVAIFNIMLYPMGWGTLAAGGVLSLTPNRGPGIDTLAIGPALGVVAKHNKWTYGVFSQNVFSLGDIAVTQLQPVLGYTVNPKLSFAIGDAQYTMDWNKGRFVNVPMSFQINYIARIEEQPIHLFFNPQYNLINEPGARKWSLTVGAALLVK